MQSDLTHLECNEEQPCHSVALRRKQRPAHRATDATDTVLPGCRFYGRLVPYLYNGSRPHRILRDRTPRECAREYAASRVLAAT